MCEGCESDYDGRWAKISFTVSFSSKYDIRETGKHENLIIKYKNHSDLIKISLPLDEYSEKLLETHKDCGHGGYDKMIYTLKDKFLIPKPVIEIFIFFCKVYLKNRSQTY